jgi:hypothetical protein
MARRNPNLTPDRSQVAIDIGIDAGQRRQIADGLSDVLADTYTLYLKTHAFHWNVEGPMFNTLHQMFMEQYTELWNALDAIAERIRSLGFPAPGTYREFAKRSSIEETEGVPEAMQRVRGRSFPSWTAPATSRPPISSRSACRCTRRLPGCFAASSPENVPEKSLTDSDRLRPPETVLDSLPA